MTNQAASTWSYQTSTIQRYVFTVMRLSYINLNYKVVPIGLIYYEISVTLVLDLLEFSQYFGTEFTPTITLG